MTSSTRRWAVVSLILLLSLPFIVQAVAANWAEPGPEHQDREAARLISPQTPYGGALSGDPPHPYTARFLYHLPVVLKDYIPGQAPTPTSLVSPTPTDTATPSPTPSSTATSTATPSPTPTNTPTPTPTLACATATQGCVTVLVYSDQNGTGQRDPGEARLPEAAISISNINNIEAPRIVADYTTDGQSEPYPFLLRPGSYTIHEDVPAANHTAPPIDYWDISILADQVINIEFGDLPRLPGLTTQQSEAEPRAQSVATSPDQVGQLCVWSFEDRDEDGIKDPWDPIVPGSEIIVKLGPGPFGTEIASAFTQPGDFLPRCFTLNSGVYYVEEIEPFGYVSTTPDERGAIVAAGQRLDVIFGNRRDPRDPRFFIVIKGILREGDRDERIVIANTGKTAVDLSGWRIRSFPEDYSHWFTFPNDYILGPRAEVRIHSGREAEDYADPPSEAFRDDLFWIDRPVWDDAGDSAFLYDRDGNIVDTECYGIGCILNSPPTYTPVIGTFTPTRTPTETPSGMTATPTTPAFPPTATFTPSPTPTAVPPAAVIIADLQPYDRNEVVVLVNNWTGPLDLNHWSLVSLESGDAFDFDFPVPFELQPGEEVRIHSGPDAFSKPPDDLFWTVVPVWDDVSDTAVLYDPAGNQIDSYCYGGILDCRLHISEIQPTDSDEYIEIKNGTAFSPDLTNWRIESVNGEEWYWFPEGFDLARRGTTTTADSPAREIRLDTVRIYRSQPMTPTTRVLLWYQGSDLPSGRPVWDNEGDQGVLYDANGTVVDVFCYGGVDCYFTPTPIPTATFGPGTPAPTPTSTPTRVPGTFCTDLQKPLDIPDDDPVGISSTIVVTDVRPITDLEVGLDISHSWVGDLVVRLTHEETDRTVVLIDRPGIRPDHPPGTFGCPRDDINATLDDQALSLVDDACAITKPAISGSFRPDFLPVLRAFEGEIVEGHWKLTVADNALVDTGSLNNWCLVTSLPTPTSTPTITPGGPALTPTGTATSTPTPTVTPTSTGLPTPPPQRTLTPEEVIIETIRYSTTDEFITLRNVGSQTVVLVDWEIRSVRGDEWYRFPEPILLHPNKSVRIHSGPHAHVDPPTDLLWYDGSDEIPGSLIWNDLADAAVLYGRVRDIKDVYCYGYDACNMVISTVSGCRLDESITIWNQAIVHRNMTGWQIWSLTGDEVFNFPENYIVPPNGVVLVHSGPEAFCDPPTNILWHNPTACPFDPRERAGPQVWDDMQQDRAVLVDPNGILVSTFLHRSCGFTPTPTATP